MKKLFIFLILLFSANLFAQESYFELLRQDIATKKVALITQVMKFTDKEAEVFWPLYREFDLEKSKLGDETLKLIKDYALHFKDITDEKAFELMTTNYELQKKDIDLKQTYLKKFSKVLAPARAVKVMQVINQIDLVIDMQITSQIPLIGEPIEVMEDNEGFQEQKGRDLK